jgi:probable HAF family extracellular repeat protein
MNDHRTSLITNVLCHGRCFLLKAIVGFHIVSASGQTYTVTDLGTYTDKAGQTLSGPRTINSIGQLAGINVIGSSYRALIYGGSWTNLGTLGGTDSYAAGINSSARVVGYSLNASALDHAFLWTPGGTGGVPGNVQMKDLGTLGGNSSEAYAINQAGQITGYAQNGQNDRAFLYSGGVMTDIGARLGSSLPNSYGYGINDSAHVTGTAYNSSFSVAHAFFYNGTTAVDIGSLGQGANGLAINNNDQITGYSTTSAGVDHALRYASGVLTDLKTLGGDYSYGNGINNSNVIVGGSFTDAGKNLIYHAFIASGNSVSDLNTNLDSSGSGWVLVEARAINDAGQIVGVGTLGGVNHGFLLSSSLKITKQPTNTTVACQGNASFSVTATPLPLSYQWYKGNPPTGAAIPNATNKLLTLTNVTGAQTGPYYVVVRSTGAVATSSVATLSVMDSAPPVISGCPINITNTTDQGLCSAVVTWTNPTAMDACDGVVAVICAPTNGSRFSKGLTVVTCSAHDGSGNTNTCSFTVTVVDNQSPVISGCPGNLTNYITPGSTSAVVTWSTPTASDNCDGNVPVVCTPPSGSLFTVGSTSVTCRASDTSSNSDSCSFTVDVAATDLPLITDFKVAGTNVVIRFSTIIGGQYAVQTSGGLTGSWTDELTRIPGTGASVTATNFGGATFLPRFFRIKLSLP